MNIFDELRTKENSTQSAVGEIKKDMNKKIERDFNPAIVYVSGAIVIAVLLYSDAMAIAESLKTGYPNYISYFIAFGIVGAIDLIYFGTIFAVKQLFAFGKLAFAAWAFYLAMAIVLGWFGTYSAALVINHIDALGTKNRRILNPFDYSGNPSLISAERNVMEIREQIDAADKAIFTIARTVEQTSNQASMFAASLKAAAHDTGMSERQKRDIAYYAGRANKSSAGTVSALSEMQKDRQRLAVSLLVATDRRNSLQDSISARFGNRSAEDVVEADMGISLKRGVATMTQFSVVAVILVMMMMRFAYTGKSIYHPFVFVPSIEPEKKQDDAEEMGLVAVNVNGKLIPIEEHRRNEFKAGSRKEAEEWLYWRTLIGELVRGSKLEPGDLSYSVRHSGVKKTCKANLWKKIQKAEKFMAENSPEAVQTEALRLEQQYGFKRKAALENTETGNGCPVV